MHTPILRNRPQECNEKKSPTDSRGERQSPPPYSSLPLRLQRDPQMTDRIATLLLALAGYAWGRAAVCWPSNATLAAELGKHPGTVKRIIAEAEAAGFLVRLPGRVERVFVLPWKVRGGGAKALPPGDQKRASRSATGARPESLKANQERKESAGGVMATQGPPPPAQDNPEAAQGYSGCPREHDLAAAAASKHETLSAMARDVLAGHSASRWFRAELAREGVFGDEALRALAGVPLAGAEPPAATIAAPPLALSAPSGRRSSLPPPRTPQPFRPAQGRRPGRFRGRGAVALGEILGHSQVAVSCGRAAMGEP